MKTILEISQPYVETILRAVLALVAAVILSIIYKLRAKVEAWLEAKTSVDQRDLLHKLAAEAYAYVERQYTNGGADKLDYAVQYVLDRLDLDKAGITSKDVMAAVQKAWTELDKKNRGAVDGKGI